MNFVFLRGSRYRAVTLVTNIASGKIQPGEKIRLLGYTVDGNSIETLVEIIGRAGKKTTWPFIAQSDDDEMLLRLAW